MSRRILLASAGAMVLAGTAFAAVAEATIKNWQRVDAH